jgi:hypothetical protein
MIKVGVLGLCAGRAVSQGVAMVSNDLAGLDFFTADDAHAVPRLGNLSALAATASIKTVALLTL